MDGLNFELMAQETLTLRQSSKTTKEIFGSALKIQHLSNKKTYFHFLDEEKAPEAPGVLYKLDQAGNTFSVRGMSTDDLSYALDDLEAGDEKLRKKFRLKEDEGIENIRFFETNCVHLAEVLEDQLLNRRFPVEEDVLCNLSDPGFSWWLDIGDHYLEIFFTSHGIHRDENYVKLGPMGDAAIANYRLKQAEDWFRKKMSVGEFSLSEKAFGISSANATQENFKAIRALFQFGDLVLTDEDFPSDLGGQTLFYYFRELAATRKLWLEIENQVKKPTISLA